MAGTAEDAVDRPESESQSTGGRIWVLEEDKEVAVEAAEAAAAWVVLVRVPVATAYARIAERKPLISVACRVTNRSVLNAART